MAAPTVPAGYVDVADAGMEFPAVPAGLPAAPVAAAAPRGRVAVGVGAGGGGAHHAAPARPVAAVDPDMAALEAEFS